MHTTCNTCFAAIALTALSASTALAGSSTTVVYGQNEANTVPVLAGTAPINTTNSDAYIGSGSWQANGTSKSSMWLSVPATLGTFTVGDIAHISWHTKTQVSDNFDWYLTIYTEADTVDDDASWYGRRLTIENLYANNYSETLNAWNEWSTDAGTNQVTFHDGNRTNFGFYNGPTLADVTAGPLDWSNYATSGSTDVIDYSSETVMDIVFETGSAWAANYAGLIDGITITLDNGNSVTYDLEVVPSPGALALLGLAGIAARRRRRN